jgi:hypothetical protein
MRAALGTTAKSTQDFILGYSQPSLSGLFLLLPPAMVCPFGN